ncbi:MAG: NAD(P)/FAD-dependent oxidoreductase [Candidatus Omnitrophica bacterium]|nr:NAD(P)/FAD-dependent oxidoreductase [Candidatus Omnitrophota bacterium]
MAAIRAAMLAQEVVLVERNPVLGRKLLLSGKGRCNITNACQLDAFLERFFSGGQFLRDAFKKFFNVELMAFCAESGLKLKIERQNRVFPTSDNSATVVKFFKRELLKNKVEILFGRIVVDILLEGNRVKGTVFKDGKTLSCDRVILATGGASYSFTGSDGLGMRIAERLGHTIVRLQPALVPLETKQRYPLEGLTLKNIRIKFSDGKKEIVSGIGELLFTSAGISGPLVLTLSGKIATWLNERRRVYAEIDLKPALSREEVLERLNRQFREYARKNLRNNTKELLPARLVDVFISLAKIAPEKKASYITRKERQRLADLLKGFRMDIERTAPLEEAMVTQGGVSLSQINPRTMESRIVKGLYFAGEMIDVDADTGGFNLQAAFSTGYLAGESAALS